MPVEQSPVAVVAEAQQQVHRSRWGFHPCDWAHFAKLKKLHALYWRATYASAAWRRWQAKLPKNRVHRNYGPGGRRAGGKAVETPWAEPVSFYVPEYAVLDYQSARMPKTEAALVTRLRLTGEQVDKMLAELSYLDVETRARKGEDLL